MLHVRVARRVHQGVAEGVLGGLAGRAPRAVAGTDAAPPKLNPGAAGAGGTRAVSTAFAGAAVVVPPKSSPPAAGFAAEANGDAPVAAAEANGDALVAEAPPPKLNPPAAAGFVSAAGSSGFFSDSGDAASFAFPPLGGVPNPNPLPGSRARASRWRP